MNTATSFHPVRRRAGKPAGVAGLQGRPDPTLHIQRYRPLESSDSGAGQPIGWASRCSSVTCAFRRHRWASMNYRSALVEAGRRPAQGRRRKLERVRPAGADPARAPERAANRVRFPALHHEPLPAGRPDADRAGDANRQRHRAGQRLNGRLRRQSVILPPSTPSSGRVPRRSPVLTGASTTPSAEPLADAHRRRLDNLLKRRDNGKRPGWLGCASLRPSQIRGICWNTSNASRHGRHSNLPTGIERLVHQNRLLKIAREGGQMTPADIARLGC